MKDNLNVFYTIEGKEVCDEEVAVSILLKEGILFCGEVGKTITIHVLCNDIFAWGCADSENLPLNEVSNLYKMWKQDSKWGSVKWCCLKRKEKPQFPIVEAMKKNGSWDDMLEQLPPNKYNICCKSHP